jgi:hypothetical protein
MWKECKKCNHLTSKKMFYCSDGCFATHEDECKQLMNKFERFRITKNLS